MGCLILAPMRDLTDQSRPSFWTPTGRVVVFALAATSIACLLTEFYRVCPMRRFASFIFFPATGLLFVFAAADRCLGDRRLWRAVMIGASAGLLAAIVYDLFRLPFVFARELGIESVVPTLSLFKVFPRFGAMILGQPLEQPAYSLAARLIGWAYHFSNGLTFGVMYLAMIGDGARRHWGWAVAMAAGLELAMLLTPYPTVLGIHITGTFVAVTLAVHLIFGVAMGRATQWWSRRQEVESVEVAP
jgi:hypothetical protein